MHNYMVFCLFSTRFNEFDHRFFGISEAEANFMDPQQKLLLQCSYRALEDSGIPMEKVSGSRTGVYIGNNSIRVFQLNAVFSLSVERKLHELHYRTDIWSVNNSSTVVSLTR